MLIDGVLVPSQTQLRDILLLTNAWSAYVSNAINVYKLKSIVTSSVMANVLSLPGNCVASLNLNNLWPSFILSLYVVQSGRQCTGSPYVQFAVNVTRACTESIYYKTILPHNSPEKVG